MGELFRRFWLPAMLPGGSWSPGTTSTPSGDYRGLGSTPIEAALDNKKFCILRNHGLLTVGRSVEESVGVVRDGRAGGRSPRESAQRATDL